MSAFESAFESERKRPNEGYSVWKFFVKFTLYVAIFALFTMNLLAVSMSIQCNRNKAIFLKIASAIYAFFFGFMYIIFNYYFYRITVKGDYTSCNFCSEYPFSF
jgi:lipopolysaccharide export LptBFGC system permease protein LptF